MRTVSAILPAVFVAALLATSPADAASHVYYSQPVCYETGGLLSRHVSLCIKGKYQVERGKCPDWRKVILYIGHGGGALEEGNGAVVRGFKVRRRSGRVVLRAPAFNLLETAKEDRYRHALRIDTRRAFYLRVTGNAELLVDHGTNRNVRIDTRLIPLAVC